MQSGIETIAVIGATEKGCALAELLLGAGYSVVLEEVMEPRLRKAAAGLAALADSSRLSLASSVEEAVREADLIIETVADELEMKLELFTIFDKFAKPNAILASSTELLRVADISDVTVCRERCIGFRLSEAANIVELTCRPEAAADTIAACEQVARRMGRKVIRVVEAEQRELQPISRSTANNRDQGSEPGESVAQTAGKK